MSFRFVSFSLMRTSLLGRRFVCRAVQLNAVPSVGHVAADRVRNINRGGGAWMARIGARFRIIVLLLVFGAMARVATRSIALNNR